MKACRKMPKSWKEDEKLEMGVTPCTKEWLAREMQEPWHKSLHKKKIDWNEWMQEEVKEPYHKKLKLKRR